MNQYTRWPFAKGGEGNLLVVTLMLAVAALAHAFLNHKVTRFFLYLIAPVWLLVVYFFRDPERETVNRPGLVIAPGDGEVVEIVTEKEGRYLQQEMVRVSIFLSVFDVHVQRVPISGRVALIEHRPGKFLQAFKPEASEVNENIATLLETEFGPVLMKQIAGILARRCVNYLHEGSQVQSGERLGLIRFSSRVDLFLPAGTQLLVNLGDKVYGGITPIGQMPAGKISSDNLPLS
jgi:phosphatidylserine decarboxylase